MKKLFLLSITSMLFANSLMDDGVFYFKEKNYKKAYEIFKNLAKENPNSKKINILLGVSAEKLKKYNEAIAAFERVLIYYPDDKEAKYLLGKLYIKLKRYFAAREILKDLDYKDSKKYYLIALALIKKHFFNYSLSLGYVYDSNVNNVTDDEYGIYIGDIYLKAKSDKKSDSGLMELFSLNHRYLTQNYIWEDSFYIYNKNYFKEKSEDFTIINYTPSIRFSNFKTSLILSHIRLDNEAYLNNYGVGFSVKNFELKAIRKDYVDYKDRNYFEAKYSFTTLLKPYIAVGIERGDGFESDSNSLKVGGSYKRGIFKLDASYEAKNYLDANYLFDKKRKDRIFDVRASIIKQVKKFYIVGSAEYIKHNSNIAPDDYDKKTLSINFVIPFKG